MPSLIAFVGTFALFGVAVNVDLSTAAGYDDQRVVQLALLVVAAAALLAPKWRRDVVAALSELPATVRMLLVGAVVVGSVSAISADFREIIQ